MGARQVRIVVVLSAMVVWQPHLPLIMALLCMTTSVALSHGDASSGASLSRGSGPDADFKRQLLLGSVQQVVTRNTRAVLGAVSPQLAAFIGRAAQQAVDKYCTAPPKSRRDVLLGESGAAEEALGRLDRSRADWIQSVVVEEVKARCRPKRARKVSKRQVTAEAAQRGAQRAARVADALERAIAAEKRDEKALLGKERNAKSTVSVQKQKLARMKEHAVKDTEEAAAKKSAKLKRKLIAAEAAKKKARAAKQAKENKKVEKYYMRNKKGMEELGNFIRQNIVLMHKAKRQENHFMNTAKGRKALKAFILNSVKKHARRVRLNKRGEHYFMNTAKGRKEFQDFVAKHVKRKLRSHRAANASKKRGELLHEHR